MSRVKDAVIHRHVWFEGTTPPPGVTVWAYYPGRKDGYLDGQVVRGFWDPESYEDPWGDPVPPGLVVPDDDGDLRLPAPVAWMPGWSPDPPGTRHLPPPDAFDGDGPLEYLEDLHPGIHLRAE